MAISGSQLTRLGRAIAGGGISLTITAKAIGLGQIFTAPMLFVGISNNETIISQSNTETIISQSNNESIIQSPGITTIVSLK